MDYFRQPAVFCGLPFFLVRELTVRVILQTKSSQMRELKVRVT